MKVIEAIGYRERNLERMAARHGFTFHIDGSYLTPHAGWKSETREATEEEQSMWYQIVGDFDPEKLPATPEEVYSSFLYRDGPFTINAEDFQALRQLSRNFDPATERSQLLSGLMGWFIPGDTDRPSTAEEVLAYMVGDKPRPAGIPVYVSRAIQVGFFYEGHEPALHARVLPGEPRQLAPELPEGLDWKIMGDLKPFTVRY